MTRRWWARTITAGLIGAGVLAGVDVLAGDLGVARADPDDAVPPIIDDLGVTIPALSLDPRDRDGAARHWPGTGNYCQNRYVTCRVGGF
ncbi:hypothetical protein [Mycobacterium vicinigordonae]|uniref:Uncharacterized protein n=1 Tax=Mycobacterium vicinigordonae TaxID=1719132 RepID=A0A7D6I993_9MYCO|nr:hypothetical protein [Mycobacterium vicinigordonae]QLL08956.1 hypothetical protein H0P51_08720 [Mycobacterium vicinigordonae]